MTLEEKLANINTPAIEELPNGHDNTINDFFNNFVLPRLPKREIVKKWHCVLMEYTSNLSNISCCVRYGNNGSKKPSTQGETGYAKLRRGWLTKNTTDNFEYFFADNFFSSFIYKMALDDYCPSLNELKDTFFRHKFPYGFGFMVDKKVQEYKGVTIEIGQNPGFLGNYKLSHVFEAGSNFDINGEVYGDALLSPLYYDIGHSEDFLNNKDHIRIMEITDEAKKVIIAKFLRFSHPINYFLTPTKNKHICDTEIYKKDIGEDPRMIEFVKSYLQNEYSKEYNEFLSRIMWHNGANDSVAATGTEYIGITYGNHIFKPKAQAKKISNIKSRESKRTVIDLDNITELTLNKYKAGIIADKVLRSILSSGEISKEMVDRFKNERGSQSTFALSLPLLALSVKDAHGYNRYYCQPIYLYGEPLYLNSQWSTEKQKSLLVSWIIDWLSSNGRTITYRNNALFLDKRS